MELSKEFKFEAAHVLPLHKGKCSRLHGHSWLLRVYVEGDVNPSTGFVMDYGVIKEVVQPIVDQLDHSYLGDGLVVDTFGTPIKGYLDLGIYPSSENLCVWVADQIGSKLAIDGCYWSKIEIEETCTSRCMLTDVDYMEIVEAREKHAQVH